MNPGLIGWYSELPVVFLKRLSNDNLKIDHGDKRDRQENQCSTPRIDPEYVEHGTLACNLAVGDKRVKHAMIVKNRAKPRDKFLRREHMGLCPDIFEGACRPQGGCLSAHLPRPAQRHPAQN